MREIFIFGMSAWRSEGRASVTAAPEASEERNVRRFMGDTIAELGRVNLGAWEWERRALAACVTLPASAETLQARCGRDRRPFAVKPACHHRGSGPRPSRRAAQGMSK